MAGRPPLVWSRRQRRKLASALPPTVWWMAMPVFRWVPEKNSESGSRRVRTMSNAMSGLLHAPPFTTTKSYRVSKVELSDRGVGLYKKALRHLRGVSGGWGGGPGGPAPQVTEVVADW